MIDSTAAIAGAQARRRHGVLVSERRLLLIALDVVAVALAYVLAFNVWTAQVRNAGFYVPRGGTVAAVAVWLVAAQAMNAYDLRRAASLRGIAATVAGTVMFSALGLLLLFFAMPYRITRPTILLWVPLAALLVGGARLAYRHSLSSARLAQPIALVATGDVLERIWPEVREQCAAFYRVQHVIDPQKAGAGERIAALAGSRRVTEVILGVRDDISRELFGSLVRCYEGGLRVRSLADLYEELTGRLLLDQLGHSWLMSIPMRSDSSRIYRAGKRAVDVCAALVGLVALGLFLPFVALAMRVDDRGPLFHRQQRVGRYGSVFLLTKLRTMRVNDKGAGEWTAEKDPRITRVGRVLRALHLDELPQAWSILRGDMSVIGPRPEQPQYVERLREQIDFYNARLTVAPGLTGWAQVNYGYGAGVEGARHKLSYDLYYVKRQSLALDMLILGRTLVSVLSLRGR